MTQYNSQLSNLDKAFVITFTCNNMPVVAELTVGKVIIEDTNSPGRTGEKIFDNYKPQHSYIEKYMCVETGIGSGTVYEYGKHIFKTQKECDETVKTFFNKSEEHKSCFNCGTKESLGCSSYRAKDCGSNYKEWTKARSLKSW